VVIYFSDEVEDDDDPYTEEEERDTSAATWQSSTASNMTTSWDKTANIGDDWEMKGRMKRPRSWTTEPEQEERDQEGWDRGQGVVDNWEAADTSADEDCKRQKWLQARDKKKAWLQRDATLEPRSESSLRPGGQMGNGGGRIFQHDIRTEENISASTIEDDRGNADDRKTTSWESSVNKMGEVDKRMQGWGSAAASTTEWRGTSSNWSRGGHHATVDVEDLGGGEENFTMRETNTTLSSDAAAHATDLVAAAVARQTCGGYSGVVTAVDEREEGGSPGGSSGASTANISPPGEIHFPCVQVDCNIQDNGNMVVQ